jgi:hypothetical protein
MSRCVRCEQRPAATLLGTTLCLICGGLMPEPKQQTTDDLAAAAGGT